jgi:hemolysin activation/secretion protein
MSAMENIFERLDLTQSGQRYFVIVFLEAVTGMLRALTSNENLIYSYVSYQIPVGGRGLRLGGAYSDSSYCWGKELAASQTHGTASIASLFAVYPFIRRQKSNLSGTFTLDDKQLNDIVSINSSVKQVQVGTFDLVGNHQDTLGEAA